MGSKNKFKILCKTWFAFLTFAIPGCGGPADESHFIGTWIYQDGSHATITCPGQAPMRTDLANPPEMLTITSESAGTIKTLNSLGCGYRFDVSSNVATIKPGQTCNKVPDGMGSTTIEALTVDKLTANGSTMTVAASGTLGPGGACSLMVSGRLVKQ
jgi:hypothetical protein